jgi:hypothetical protein
MPSDSTMSEDAGDPGVEPKTVAQLTLKAIVANHQACIVAPVKQIPVLKNFLTKSEIRTYMTTLARG